MRYEARVIPTADGTRHFGLMLDLEAGEITETTGLYDTQEDACRALAVLVQAEAATQ